MNCDIRKFFLRYLITYFSAFESNIIKVKEQPKKVRKIHKKIKELVFDCQNVIIHIYAELI